MDSVYLRNKYYISSDEQEKIKTFKFLLAGCGIGSNIAECALRLGFENQTLIDGDSVELSNLNRQNYIQQDTGSFKAEALKRRLTGINPTATIVSKNIFFDETNIECNITGHQIAINALDFQSGIPFLFDELCRKQKIPVLHPYNIGWATLIFVISPNGPDLSSLSADPQGFEKKVVSFLLDNINGYSKEWIASVLAEYDKNGQGESPPQLSVGSWLAAAACTTIACRLALGKPVKVFPDFYFVSLD